MLKKRPPVSKVLMTLLAIALIAPSLGVVAQEKGSAGQQGFVDPSDPLSAQAALAPIDVVLGNILPSMSFRGTDYETGGTGMRNQARGGITINGVTGTPVAAFLYWAVITAGPPVPALHQRQRIQRRAPTVSADVIVSGTVVGVGGSPCWPGNTLTVFRAAVPLAVASGNGHYQVTIMPGSTSSIAGEDPWEVGLPPPLEEGKSLVIVYEDAQNKITEFYDIGLSGTLYFGSPGLFYGNDLTFSSVGGFMKWDNITADGQKGAGRSAVASTADEKTFLDGVQVAGPGSPANDSDQNGNDSTPVPQLWDTRGHRVAGSIGADGLIDVEISAVGGGDCLNAVANILNYQFATTAAPE